MSLNQLHSQLKEKEITHLFTDYYDTIVHRHVHPNYTQRIWAKLIIRELGLPISIDELYFTRQESVKFLINELEREDVEIPYSELKQEVCKRLINAEIISKEDKARFISLFEEVDVRAEADVQYLNQEVLDTLKYFKSNGGKVYLVSDFYGSKSLFKKLLAHHNILELFDEIYSSSELEKCKHTGNIYPAILSELAIDPKSIMMIGDNHKSDYTNAINNGLNAYHLPHKKYLKKNKRNNFGNDKKTLNKIINGIYKISQRRNTIPYTEYIVFYHTFIERVYEKCKRDNVKDLFFLSREGQFLKKLFDSYQNFASIDGTNKINSHYLKISRQASLQIALKNIDDEDFGYLQSKYSNLSVDDFLLVFNCSEELRHQIISEQNIDGKAIVEDFFNSDIFKSLIKNKTFRSFYDAHRVANHNAFTTYINSFNADIETKGITLVDIGWGGTMQESLHKFFKYQIPVTGYYLGLAEIYNILPDTKRLGLNFSILPYVDYNDAILMANMQLYEQFSAADHGSILGYSLNAEDYSLEYHKPEEKWLYETHIKSHQEKMLELHQLLLKQLETVCYSRELMQESVSKLALKVGLFQNTRKLKFLEDLSHGFYQNIGDNQVGISYERPKIKSPIKSLIRFLITPEKYFRYLVKLKPALYKKSKILAMFTPMYLIYLYFGINRYIRFKILHRYFLLKYNAFK